jgi:UDP-glucose 4-epimerase
MRGLSKVLVTGGAGFIGSHLVDKLISRGYSVVVLDNFHSGEMESFRKILGRESFEVIEGDIRDRKAVREAMDGVDAVVHLAALIDVEESVNNPLETHDVNVNGTLNVLNEAVRSGVRKLLFASSTAVYGEGNPLPLREEHSLNPISPYAASKVSAEYYCKAFNNCYGLSTVVLRFFNVYGLGQKHSSYSGVISKFLQNALNGEPLILYGDGEQARDFIYVDDVVEATVLALENGDSKGETFNVCTGKPTAVNELVQIVKEVVKRDLKVIYDKPRKGDIKNNYGDPSKTEEILGFKAKISLREGLERLRNSYSNFCSST